MDAETAAVAPVPAAVTSMLFGLIPALRSAGAGQALGAGRTAAPGSGARTLQRTLVVAEVALSIVPLACGRLMLRSFLNLLNAPLGFNPANIVTANVPFDLAMYSRAGQQWALLCDVIGRLRALPGVQSVSAAGPLPLAPNQQLRRVGPFDCPDAPPVLATPPGAIPGYLRVIGTPLLEGRDFTGDDIAAQHNATSIDENLAKRLWPEGGDRQVPGGS